MIRIESSVGPDLAVNRPQRASQTNPRLSPALEAQSLNRRELEDLIKICLPSKTAPSLDPAAVFEG